MTVEPIQTDKPSLAEAIRRMAESVVSGVHGPMPARVLEYDEDRQRVTVQPAIFRAHVGEDGERLAKELPPITNVPVVFPGGGDGALTFPIAKGDVVLIIICSASLDLWLEKGGVLDPTDDRRFAIDDAVAISSLRNTGGADAASGATVLSGSDVRLGSSGADQDVFRGNDWLSAFDSVVSSIVTALNGIVPAAGTPVATAYTTFKADSSIKSTKVKVD